MKCVNRSHPDYIRLKKETGLKDSILQARISLWQENSLDNPTARRGDLEAEKKRFSPGFNARELTEIKTFEELTTSKNGGKIRLSPNATKFFPDKITVTTGNEVIKMIAESDHRLAPLAKNMIGYPGLDIPIHLVSDIVMDEVKFAGVYVHPNHTIYLAGRNVDRTDVEETILHEILHGWSSRLLTQQPTKESKELYKKLNKLYKKALKNSEDFTYDYALTDIDEFLVAAFTNKETIDVLKTLPGEKENTTLWDEFLDFLASLLKISNSKVGLNQRTLLADVMDVSSRIFEHNAEIEGQFVNDLEDADRVLDGVLVSPNRMRVENISPSTPEVSGYKIHNKAGDANLTESEIDSMYENYVKMMSRKRGDLVMTKEMFVNTAFRNLSLLEIGNSKILGEWDHVNSVFKGRVLSSESIRTLYTDIKALQKSLPFMASVPPDLGVMMEKAGFSKVKQGKIFEMKRTDADGNVLASETMVKNLYFSDAALIEKVFGKPLDEVSLEEVEAYDTFFNPTMIKAQLIQGIKSKADTSEIIGLLKDLSIYDYNAYKIIRSYNRKLENFGKKNADKIFDIYMGLFVENKYKTPQAEQIDKKVASLIKSKELDKSNSEDAANMLKSISSLVYTIDVASSNKNIEVDTLNHPKVYNELNNELNKTLTQYLSNFGIDVKLVEDIQDRLNIDSFAVLDILNKLILSDKDNQTEIPEKASEIIVYMMQFNPAVTEIMKYMDTKSMFRKGVISKEDKLKSIADLLNNELHKKSDTKLPETLIEKLNILFEQFMRFLSSPAQARVNRKVGEIANQVLAQNQALITASLYKPGAFGQKTMQVSLEEAMNRDEFGKQILEELSAKGFILTGSTALGEQGTITRPDENLLHDIDWVSPFNRKLTRDLFKESYPDAIFIRDIMDENKEQVTDTWLIAPEGHKITEYEVTETEGRIIVKSYNVRDSSGKIVGSFENIDGVESSQGVSGKVIDFFSYREFNRDTSKKAKGIFISDWRDIFEAKLKFARYKDIWDYNRFKPNSREDAFPSTREITEMFNSGNDVSLQKEAPIKVNLKC